MKKFVSMILVLVLTMVFASSAFADSVPTIGIGAGADCDGQVLVLHDMLGLYSEFTPRFVKRYAELGTLMEQAVRDYAEEVRSGAFPTPAHSFNMDEEERARLEDRLRETE